MKYLVGQYSPSGFAPQATFLRRWEAEEYAQRKSQVNWAYTYDVENVGEGGNQLLSSWSNGKPQYLTEEEAA